VGNIFYGIFVKFFSGNKNFWGKKFTVSEESSISECAIVCKFCFAE